MWNVNWCCVYVNWYQYYCDCVIWNCHFGGNRICEKFIVVCASKFFPVLHRLCVIECYWANIRYVKCVLMFVYNNRYRYYCDSAKLNCYLGDIGYLKCVLICVYVNFYPYYSDIVLLYCYWGHFEYVKCLLICVYVNSYRYYCDCVILNFCWGNVVYLKCVLLCVYVNCYRSAFCAIAELLLADNQFSNLRTADWFTDLYFRYLKIYLEHYVTSGTRD
jgi:hypothetical protein